MEGGHRADVQICFPWYSKHALEIKLVFGVFMCLILPTQKFMLGKNAKIRKNEVSQDVMRF